MQKLMLLLLLISLTACNGCTGTTPAPGTPAVTQTSTIEQAQVVATKSVLALGEVVVTAPGLLKGFRAAGKMTKEEYNSSVDVYNRALASYVLLNKGLQAAIAAGKDPTNVSAYTDALAKFLLDRNLLNNIITATGGKP